MERPAGTVSAAASVLPPPAPRGRRFGLVDVLVLAFVAIAALYVLWRAQTVLRYNWNWAPVWGFVIRYDPAKDAWIPNLILSGLWTTVRMSVWAAVFAALIGGAMGMARVSNSLFLRLVSRSYVELVRNVPPLVFIFVVYFFLTSQIAPVLGLDVWARQASPEARAFVEATLGPAQHLPALASAVACLALFEGAYVTEIVRGGIESIDRGQWEASRSLGFTRWMSLRLVVLPQAIQRTLPPLAGQFISLVKDSSIVSLISIQDLTFLGNEVAATTTRVFEAWIIVAVLYFVLCFALSRMFARLEARLGRFR
ncbi:MAG: amino acid ABC transporter permease [Rhodospirillales bacterium]|nr:amino acid ABC transporter permease [Rhodospirillales bacterium]